MNQHNNQLPVDLLAQLVEHSSSITDVKGSNPTQAWIFSGLIFTTAKVVFITEKIVFIFLISYVPIQVESSFAC